MILPPDKFFFMERMLFTLFAGMAVSGSLTAQEMGESADSSSDANAF